MFNILKRGWNYGTMRALCLMLGTDRKLLEWLTIIINYGIDPGKVVPSSIHILVLYIFGKTTTESWVAIFVHFKSNYM